MGRPTSPAAVEAVSDDLRRGQDEFLSERRRLAALSMSAMASLDVVAAYRPSPPTWPSLPRLSLAERA
ncbi:MAG: hypothetical protein M3N68_14335 [Actinomycetota bacterium]|nr:hypothetical protein [Actinomycetota bacterium]